MVEAIDVVVDVIIDVVVINTRTVVVTVTTGVCRTIGLIMQDVGSTTSESVVASVGGTSPSVT